MKVFCAKFNRAENALDTLIEKLKQKKMLTTNYDKADYFLISGDRCEMFDFAVRCLRDNKKMIHLWAGECDKDWSTHDEYYRSFITICSVIQLCTNEHAVARVVELCRAVDKKPNVYVVGNVMLDDLATNETKVPKYPYDLILYNPTTRLTATEVNHEIKEITKLLCRVYYWIEPNGDMYSDLLKPYVNMKSLTRPMFLGLLKNCQRFITNSSCQYYEAPSFLRKEQIISVGERNAERESKYADMTITGATDKIIKILEGLN